MEESDSDIDEYTPPDICEIYHSVTNNLLPNKSKDKYEKQYNLFKMWCVSKNVHELTENVLLAYMTEKSTNMMPTSLWSIYSMLKTTLRIKENIDIGQFNKLLAFVKQKNVSYKPKRSKIFTKNEIRRFLLEASDDQHLLRKVCLIFGISGACSREELTKLRITDVEDFRSVLIVTIPGSKTFKRRVFTITDDQENEVDYLTIIRKYLNLRPASVTTYRFFIRFHNGRCVNQNIGINTIGKIPAEIAEFLKLPEPAMYTGHCFRRTSAALLVNAGGSMTQLKRNEGSKSSTVTEDYIEDVMSNKKVTAQITQDQSDIVQIKEETSIQSTSGAGVTIKDSDMEISFANKRVLVTGAGKGIGRDLCKKLLKCGAYVIAISRTKETLDSLTTEAPGIETICLDLAADWDKTRSVVENIGPIDCLVNNAAIAICTPFLETPPEEFDILFNINVKVIMNISQVVAKGMIKQGKGGSIVNISSQASQAALKDHAVYCGTKAAVDIMSKVMALELGPHNIRVNCVNPTVVMTDMGRVGWSDPNKAAEMLKKIPLNRFAEVDEVVNSILFLLSDLAPIVNGVTLPVDGGFLAC